MKKLLACLLLAGCVTSGEVIQVDNPRSAPGEVSVYKAEDGTTVKERVIVGPHDSISIPIKAGVYLVTVREVDLGHPGQGKLVLENWVTCGPR